MVIDKVQETVKDIHEKVKDILTPEKEAPSEELKLKVPKHIAITMEGVKAYAENNNLPLKESYEKSLGMIPNLIKNQVKLNVTILTILVLPERMKRDTEQFLALIDSLVEFLPKLTQDALIHKKRIKISVLGKWYDLPGRVVDPIKEAMDKTKEYDDFFLNLCLNYNGQEEIVDACRIIARQVKAGKIEPEMINAAMTKDNLYTSYFIPPNIIIKTGVKHEIPALLLWDSMFSIIHFTDKSWPELKVADILRAVRKYK